jgi:hypothetical protein
MEAIDAEQLASAVVGREGEVGPNNDKFKDVSKFRIPFWRC